MYDRPVFQTYTFPAVNFATGSSNKIPVPRKATQGRVVDIAVQATTTFTQTTTPGYVQVGDGTTPAAFAQLNMGATAANDTLSSGDQAVYVATYQKGNYNSGAGLHDLIVTFVAPTGGTPAGAGTVIINMAWDQVLTA